MSGGHKPVSSFSRPKCNLDRAIGEMPDWRLHDLRRTVRTGMASPLVAELILAHQQPNTKPKSARR
jgi:hypothetical protein